MRNLCSSPSYFLIIFLSTIALAPMASAQVCAPTEIGTIDAPSAPHETLVVGDLLYSCHGDDGLRIHLIGEPASPAAPALVGAIGVSAFEIAVDGSRAYVTDGEPDGEAVSIIDVSDPSSPALLGGVVPDELMNVRDIVATGYFLYVAGDFGVLIIDVSNPAAPVIVANVFGNGADGVAIDDNVLYILPAVSGEFESYDISNPTSPVLLDSMFGGFDHTDIEIEGDILYATLATSLLAADISDPTNLSATLVSDPVWASIFNSLDVSGGVAYLIGQQGLTVLDVSTPLEPALLAFLPLPPQITGYDIAAANGHVYTDGIIFDVSTCPTAPLITLQPQSVVADTGGADVTFQISTLFETTIQWRFNGQPLPEGGAYDGVDTPTLTVSPNLATAGIYDAVVSNAQGSTTTFAAGLVVNNTCASDLDGNNNVGFSDLLLLLADWGSCND